MMALTDGDLEEIDDKHCSSFQQRTWYQPPLYYDGETGSTLIITGLIFKDVNAWTEDYHDYSYSQPRASAVKRRN